MVQVGRHAGSESPQRALKDMWGEIDGTKTIILGVTAQVPQLSTTLSVSKTGMIVDITSFARTEVANAA